LSNQLKGTGTNDHNFPLIIWLFLFDVPIDTNVGLLYGYVLSLVLLGFKSTGSHPVHDSIEVIRFKKVGNRCMARLWALYPAHQAACIRSETTGIAMQRKQQVQEISSRSIRPAGYALQISRSYSEYITGLPTGSIGR